MTILHSLAISLIALGEIVANFKGVESVGVCYGQLGDNLPQPSDVVSLYKSNGISSMRLYSPDANTLQSLRGSDIDLLLDVSNDDLQSLAADSGAAATWISNNVQPYNGAVSFRYIAVGNEVIPGDKAQFVLPAIQNVYNALSSLGLADQIKVSTSVSTAVLGVSYPPSAGAFSGDAGSTLTPIIQFLASTSAPLLVNVYPYFAYAANEGSISLPYALFTADGTVISDGALNYQNLFDAQLDAVYSALDGAGGSNVAVVVSESGWPSAGGDAASPENAQTYNQNLIHHVAGGQGTPKRPGAAIEAYVFEMFNEDEKQGGVESNFGLFYPNQQPVYAISFN